MSVIFTAIYDGCHHSTVGNLLLTKWLLFPGISLGHVNGKISAVRLGTNDAERVPRRLLRPAAQRTERAACLILRRAGVVLILLPRRSHYPGLNAGVAAPDSSAACSGPAIGATAAPPTPADPLLNRPARSSRIRDLLDHHLLTTWCLRGSGPPLRPPASGTAASVRAGYRVKTLPTRPTGEPLTLVSRST